MSHLKIKAEIFKLNTLGKFFKENHNKQEPTTKKSQLINDEFGYFNTLDSI